MGFIQPTFDYKQIFASNPSSPRRTCSTPMGCPISALSCAAINRDSILLITDGMWSPARRTSPSIGCTWHSSAGSWTKKSARDVSGAVPARWSCQRWTLDCKAEGEENSGRCAALPAADGQDAKPRGKRAAVLESTVLTFLKPLGSRLLESRRTSDFGTPNWQLFNAG